MQKIQVKKLSIGKLGVINIDLPYLIIGKGKPKGLILGLQHGSELSSLVIISELVKKRVNGQMIIVPVVNPFGVLFGTRNEPLDGKDLNRNYPGKTKGDFTQRLTAAIFSLASSCDFVVDLHSFSSRLTEITCGFTQINNVKVKNKIMKMINAINPDFVWEIDLKNKDDKRFYGAFDETMVGIGVPTIFIEMPNLPLISKMQIQKVVKGLINLFKQFGEQGINKNIIVFSAQYVFADYSGLFIPKVFPKDKVKVGGVLGEVLVLPDFRKIKIKSPYSGIIMSILGKNFVRVGTKMASVGKFVQNL